MTTTTSKPATTAVPNPITARRYALTDDQQQLRDSVARFVNDHHDFQSWRTALRSPEAMRPVLWQQMAELGWLAAAIPAEYGGLGLGQRERLILAEELGRGLATEPWWSTAALGAELILQVATSAQKALWLPRVAAGSLRLAAALYEPGGRYDWGNAQCAAVRTAQGWRLNGRKITVLDAAVADAVLVVARIDHDSLTGQDGKSALINPVAAGCRAPAGTYHDLSLFLIPAGQPGLRRNDFRAIDERHCADLELVDVDVPADHLLGAGDAAAAGIARALDVAMVTLCAEAVGVMTTALNATIDYVKTRRQFGRAIAEFQAVQHRIADMTMATEQSRSLTQLAGLHLDGDAAARRRHACAAKVQIGQAGRYVGEQGVQLHGGVGVTDAFQVGHCLKRLMALDVLLGDANHHLRRFAAAVLTDPVDPA